MISAGVILLCPDMATCLIDLSFPLLIYIAKHTVRTYVGILKVFFGFHKGKDPAEISFRDFEQFNTEYILKKGYSAAYQNNLLML